MATISVIDSASRPETQNDPVQKTIGIVISVKALDELEKQARSFGMQRNDFIRQILYRQAFENFKAS